MEDTVAVQVITKYLRKGNMARCLRDILPSAGLSKEQREKTAELVHTVVRWKHLFEHIIETRRLSPSAETYVRLALEGAQADAASYPFEYRYSCSPYVASTLKDQGEWAEYLNQTPPTTLCVNLNRSSIDEVRTMLRQESLAAEGSILPTALQTTSIGKYSRVIQEHFAHVQDESSQLVSFLAASLGHSLFDLCAGNGGKSLAIASMTKNQKDLSAYEINTTKRTTLTQRCTQYDAKVRVEESLPQKNYDLVLVDAPCTGLGAARRNPEAKYREGAGELPQIQLSLVAQAASLIKPGGVLFYAVCTLTPEETVHIIETAVRTHGFCVLEENNLSYNNYLVPQSNGFITRIPQGDLFFISVLTKPE